MNGANHDRHFEELMAWLDGELQDAEAERVRAHAGQCAECQRMEAELAHVSRRMSAWQVPPPPASFAAPRRRVWGMSRPHWMQVAAMLVLIAGGIAIWQSARPKVPDEMRLRLAGSRASAAVDVENEKQRFRAAGSVAQAQPEPGVAGAGPLLVRTARLSLVPRDILMARAEMERIAAAAGGFTGRIEVSDAQRGARSISATLRIPTAKLDETLTALKALGRVTSESQNGEDVTQQSIDLDARLSNARASEARLKEILDKRTGRLSDVLEVERELSRVRGEIEGMEAQRKSLDRRITYADVMIEMQEERKAAVDLGPLPPSTRFRNAFVDGWSAAVGSALETAVVVTRVAPLLLLWTLILAPLWFVKRRWARRP